jgi:hypothetical protein
MKNKPNTHKSNIEQIASQLNLSDTALMMAKQLFVSAVVDVINHTPDLIKLMPGMDDKALEVLDLAQESQKHFETADKLAQSSRSRDDPEWQTLDLIKNWSKNPKLMQAITPEVMKPIVDFALGAQKDKALPQPPKTKDVIGPHTGKVLESRTAPIKQGKKNSQNTRY